MKEVGLLGYVLGTADRSQLEYGGVRLLSQVQKTAVVLGRLLGTNYVIVEIMFIVAHILNIYFIHGLLRLHLLSW